MTNVRVPAGGHLERYSTTFRGTATELIKPRTLELRFLLHLPEMKTFPLYLFIAAIFLGGCAKTEHDHPEYDPPAAHEMVISAAQWGESSTYSAEVPFITQDLVDNAIIVMYVYQGDATDIAPYSDYWGPVPSPYHEIAYYDYTVGGLWLESASSYGIGYDHLIRLVPMTHRDHTELEQMGALNDLEAVLEYTQK